MNNAERKWNNLFLKCAESELPLTNTHRPVSICISFKPMDLCLKEGHSGYETIQKCAVPIGMNAVLQYEKQATHSSGGTSTLTQQQHIALDAKKKARAMSVASAPGKQILMNAFMMYMSGNQLNIFSISITSSAILSPLTSLFSVSKTFRQLDGVDLQLPKLIFIGLNLVWFAMGMYKMGSMKLLPTTSADWTGSVVWKELMESTSIPPIAMYE